MASPLTILVFSPYYPPHIGGLENHAREFAMHAVKRGHRVTIWTSSSPDHTFSKETRDGVQVFRFAALEFPGGFPIPPVWNRAFWKQYKDIRKTKYDIVISRTRFFLTSLLALIYARIYHTYYMHVEHGSDFVHLSSPLYSFLARLYDYTLGNLILRSADAVIANSAASAQFVQQLTTNTVSPTIIYRGVEQVKSIPLSHDHTTPIILYLGRLMDGKGVQDLLEALSLVHTKQWKTWIIGDGPYRKELEHLTVTLHLHDKVIFGGEKPHGEVGSYITSADIIVNPSYTEGIPTTIIEAARLGKAIIATHVGGTPEILSTPGMGILYRPHDIQGLAAHLENFLTSKELRARYGNQAKEGIQGRFSWEDAMVQYEHVWNNR